MSESNRKPQLGEIVIHRSQIDGCKFNGSKDHPAIVTRVWSQTGVNLKVLPDCGAPYDQTSQLKIDPANEAEHGWYYPARSE